MKKPFFDVLQSKQSLIRLYYVDKDIIVGNTAEFRKLNVSTVKGTMMKLNKSFKRRLGWASIVMSGNIASMYKIFTKEFKHDKAPSSAWVDRWNIRKISNVGEAGGVDQGVVTEWREVVMKYILARYEPDNVFNGDETGLFW